MAGIEAAAAELAAFLDEHQVAYMVIGGLATLVWGEPRLTEDVDITVAVEPERLPPMLDALEKRFNLLPANPKRFLEETKVLPIRTASGIRVDLILAALPYEHEALRRAVEVELGGRRVRVVCPEDLVIYKLVSRRPRDREDVAGVIRRRGNRFDRAYADPVVRELSEVLEEPDIWTFYRGCFDP